MFYLMEIATGDAKIAGKGVYEYTTLNEALSKYHTKLGTAMGSALYDSDLLVVISDDGTIYANIAYKKPEDN